MTQLTDSDSRTALGDPAAPPDSDITGATPDLDELRLSVEEAEAEAVAAEAVAAAAVARARATRLRRQVAASAAVTGTDPAPTASSAPAQSDGPVAANAPTGGDTATDKDAATGDASVADDGTVTVGPPKRVLRLPSTRSLVGAFAVALLAVSATVSGLMAQHHWETARTAQRQVEFTEAARQGVVALTSLDFSRAEQDVQRVLEHSTGAFRDDFESRAQDFTSVIQQSQVATAGTVNSAAVESMTEDSAVVLVAATSQVTNSAGAQEEPRAWRLSVTVTREGDTIKMSKVEFVP